MDITNMNKKMEDDVSELKKNGSQVLSSGENIRKNISQNAICGSNTKYAAK